MRRQSEAFSNGNLDFARPFRFTLGTMRRKTKAEPKPPASCLPRKRHYGELSYVLMEVADKDKKG
jgi:hypothetical protein